MGEVRLMWVVVNLGYSYKGGADVYVVLNNSAFAICPPKL